MSALKKITSVLLVENGGFVNELLTRCVLLPMHERLRGRRTLKYYRKLQCDEMLAGNIIKSYQEEKFSKLIQHCFDNVSYYQDIFSSIGIYSANDIDISDLIKLPILERDNIRKNLKNIIAVKGYKGKLIKYNTGGSTGEPLVFFTDIDKESQHNAQKLRARSWFGVMPGSRQVDFWGSPIELDKLSKIRIWKDKTLLNHRVLSAFNLTEERLTVYAKVLKRFRPRLIYGYPTVIYRMADYIKKHPFIMEGWQPQLISCTSEMLYDHQRNIIADVFGCYVANEYGSRDAGLIAHECPLGKMHIAMEHVFVEVDNPDQNGVGDLLITNLDGYGMPLIRYRVGDRGCLGEDKCACGLQSPILTKLEGRVNDFIVGKDGKLIHSLAPIYVLRNIPKIQQFKLLQYKNLSLEIFIVADSIIQNSELEDVKLMLRKILSLRVPVKFTFVKTIEPEKSGKYRWVVSKAEILNR